MQIKTKIVFFQSPMSSLKILTQGEQLSFPDISRISQSVMLQDLTFRFCCWHQSIGSNHWIWYRKPWT